MHLWGSLETQFGHFHVVKSAEIQVVIFFVVPLFQHSSKSFLMSSRWFIPSPSLPLRLLVLAACLQYSRQVKQASKKHFLRLLAGAKKG